MAEDNVKSKDTFILEEFPADIVFEEEAGQTSSNVIKGVFLKSNTISRNGRFYSEKIVKDFINQINAGKEIITMWTNHYPMDETLATVGKVLEAWYEEKTGLAWFKAKVASTSAGKDIISLLKDKFIEGVSIRYYPIEVKEAQIQDKMYFNVLKGELFGIDFVATRTGVPVAKIRSISSEELEEFERAFNGEEEREMPDLEKEVKETDKEVLTDKEEATKDKVDEKVEEKEEEKTKVEEKPEEKPEEKVEDKVETKEDEAPKDEAEPKSEEKEEEKKEEPKSEEKEEEKKEEPKEESEEKPEAEVEETKPEESVNWEEKYTALKANVTMLVGKLAESHKQSAVSIFDPIKEKKIYKKIMAEIDAITIADSDDVETIVNKYKESIDGVVAGYKELLEELESNIFGATEAKEQLLDKSKETLDKTMEVNKSSISEEAKTILGDYGFEFKDEDAKFLEGN
jgi:outer membrane biosynthesis protein TonB